MPRLARLILSLCLALAAGPALAAPGPQKTERIEAELVSMSQWAAPGSTAIVAVRQDIRPGWHTYWKNPGDSGGPTTLDWTLPDGVIAGDIVWPLPQRQRLQHLVNYGYEGVVYLPVPVEIPASARPGVAIPFRVQALFMVCSDEMCVPDELTLELDLPVAEGAAPLDARHGAAIQKVLETAPRPAAITATVQLADGVLTLSAVGGPLAGADIGRAWFYPDRGGVIDHAADQPGERGPEGLTLSLTPGGELKAGGLRGPVSGVLSTDVGDFEIIATPGPVSAGAAGDGALSADDKAAGAGGMGLLQAALFALIGGLILNLMPCVFPVLAMKAAALSRTAHEPKEARRDGLAFLLGVEATFLVLAGALLALRGAGEAVGWGFQLQSPAVTAALAMVLLLVGLNLSGVFHIGGGLQGAGSGPLSRLKGPAAAFMTGVLAVVVAAPCTAPFMAVALGAALVLPWPLALLVFLMLGLGLALPYLAISFSPGLMRRLPRPGPWMERLRGVLAFPMYGAALWLVWVFARQTGPEAEALLLAGGLLIAAAAWLWGWAQAGRAAGGRALAVTVAAVLALGLAVAAVITAARLPPVEAASATEAAALPSAPWSTEAVAAAQSQGRPVLVNFTADWCVTCKINERAALSSPRVAQALEDANAVYLVGDWTRRDAALAAELERHGRSGVPLYLLYRPGSAEPRVLPQILTEGTVVAALKDANAS